MKRAHLVAVVVLSLIALAFAYSQSPLQSHQTRQTATTTRQFTLERQVGTQQRINRYFHGNVVSKLKNCWGKVQGKGRIALRYTYTKAGGRWMFSRLETEQSTLPGAQANVASRCMSEAVRGTSFPVDGAESKQNTFIVSWTWPVPFPTNAAQLTSAMFAAKPKGGGGGGCDGYGTPAKCFACSDSAPIKCNTVCVGYKSCAVTIHNGSASCASDDACASGGPFGVGGGSVIY